MIDAAIAGAVAVALLKSIDLISWLVRRRNGSPSSGVVNRFDCLRGQLKVKTQVCETVDVRLAEFREDLKRAVDQLGSAVQRHEDTWHAD